MTRSPIEWVRRFHGQVFLLLNKIDQIKKPHLLPLIDHYRREFEFAEIFPISALTGEGTLDLMNGLARALARGSAVFPA